MQNNQRNTVWRFAIIFVFILLGFIAVLGKIFYIQTVERDKWLQLAEKQAPVLDTVKGSRGNILDCNGNLLATSMPQYLIVMDASVPALHKKEGELFNKYIDSLAIDIAAVTGRRTADEYKRIITNAYNKKQVRLVVDTICINYLQREQLKQNSLIKKGQFTSGFTFEEYYSRIKPYGILANRTIGSITGAKGEAEYGLEMQFDKELKGVSGINKVQRIGNRKEYITVKEPQDGMDIVTTIDANLQDIVETALIEKTAEKNAKWGCCILMETQTGYIRAIANVDRVSEGVYAEKLNHGVTRIEPGSTFKTISLMAMMNDGLTNLKDTVTLDGKKWVYFGLEHTDVHGLNEQINMRTALAVSSNIAFAKKVTDKYKGSAHKFVKSIDKLGVRDSVYIELPGCQLPYIFPPKNDTATISSMAYGYSVEVTPMTLVMFYNAIANNGCMMRPMIVTALQKDGKNVKTFQPEVLKASICSPEVLTEVKKALHDVVWDDKYGTASVYNGVRKAQSDLVSIAGKTGTAQLIIDKQHNKNHHRMTFVGYFPEDNPQYTCLCMIEDPHRPYDAGMDCGSTVRKIAEKTMAYTGCYVYRNGEKKLEKR